VSDALLQKVRVLAGRMQDLARQGTENRRSNPQIDTDASHDYTNRGLFLICIRT